MNSVNADSFSLVIFSVYNMFKMQAGLNCASVAFLHHPFFLMSLLFLFSFAVAFYGNPSHPQLVALVAQVRHLRHLQKLILLLQCYWIILEEVCDSL